VAAPEELSATELHPLRSPLPSLNATSPVGVPDAEETVAVNVSVLPACIGLADTAIVVVVAVLGGDSMSSVADPELVA
jgi:hypothetical protein